TLTSYALPVNGTYRVIVQPAASQNTQGHYEITMELSKNGVTSPRPLTYDDAAISALSDETPSNTWFFEGQAGDVIRLEVLGTSDDLDTTLKLYDPTGHLIATDDDSTASTDSEIMLTVPQTGRYLVEIARFGEAQGFTEGNYRLDLVLLYRPGHITAQPDEYLTYGERIVNRVLPELGTPQTWYFVGKAGDEITTHLQFPAGNIPLVLSLLDSSGTLLQEGERSRERTSIQNFRLPAEGIYQLRIQATRRISSGDYIPYTLSLDLLAGQSESQGGFIQAGTSAAGSFENGENAHLWLYEGQAGEQILLSVLRLAGLVLPDVTVFTPEGQVLLNLTDGTERNTHSALLTLPQSGLYQMVVISEDPFLNYRLAVNSGQTNPIAGQLIPGQVEFGYLNDAESAQTWLLEGQAGQQLVIQAAGELPFSIRLDNMAGAALATSQLNPATGQVILPTVILPDDETYQVVVTREGGILGSEQGSYRIRVSSALTAPEALTASPLLSGETVTGAASPSQKTYYLFYAEANTPLSLEFLPVSGEAIPEIRILDESGQPVTRSTGTIEDFAVNKSGYFLVEISSPTPLSFNLTFAQRSRPDQEVVEPLQRLITTVGSLTRQNPVNYWAIEAEAGESLLFEVKVFTNVLQADIVLFDPDGLPIRTLIAPDDETLFGPVFIPRDGTYMLRIGTWLNRLSAAESSYSVRVRESDEIADSQGGSIPQLGQLVFGRLSESDSQDIWTFEAQAGSRLSFMLRSSEDNAELTLSLFAPDGTEIQASDDLVVPMNGIYTLEVNLAEASSASSYELLVSETRTPYHNSLANAQGLALGEPVSGEGRSDAWVFFATAGQTITVEIDTLAVMALFSPNGTPLYAGQLENILLLEDGLYSIIVDSAQPYTLLVKTDRMRANWRWSLKLGQFEQAVLTSGSPVHEWILTGYYTGEYTISLRPASPTWKTFVLNDSNQVIASGQLQTDGTLLIRLFLDSTDEQTYSLLVAGERSGGTYQVLFDAGVNLVTPEPIQAVPVTGRIHAFNTADEWLWQGSPPLSLHAERLEGDFTMSIRIYAPGNLFLQEFMADETGQIHAENILLPVEGTYIIQVVRTEDVLSSAQGVYQLQVE
ncbi:MAG: PPC domain-containing protein, partial [Anaerolineae bacterium]|nr:PPC domain-containing protein [Anaerolineae bacterium]